MARRDLPYPAPRRSRWRHIPSACRAFVEVVTSDFGPLALGLEYGVGGIVVGVGIWLIFGLIMLAFLAGDLSFAALQRRA